MGFSTLVEAVRRRAIVTRASQASTLQVPEGYTASQFVTNLSNPENPQLGSHQTPIHDSNRKRLGLRYHRVMNSTKRKFDTLLNSLTADSNTYTSLTSSGAPRASNDGGTNTPTQSETDSQKKKRRIARPFSFASAATSHFVATGPYTATGNESPVMSGGVLRNSTIIDPSRKTPNFAPWDRAAFLARLKTFAPVTAWGIKPAKISELHWAKRGWSCVETDRVRCLGGCEKEVHVKLFPDEDDKLVATEGQAESEEAEWSQAKKDELTERYAKMIIDEHDEDCLWRKRGCDDTIYHMSLNPPSKSIAAFKSRYESLLTISTFLPTVLVTPDELDLPDLIDELPGDFLKDPESDGPAPPLIEIVNPRAFALALFGWRADGVYLDGMATCDACFRRLGLWLFKDKPNTNVDPSDLDSDSGEGTVLIGKLDLGLEHRDYCPWINRESQNGVRKPDSPVQLNGWEMLVIMLQNMHITRSFSPNALTESSSGILEGAPGSGAADVPSIRSDGASSVGSIAGNDDRDAKDKERWAKLKKLKKAFEIKPSRKKAGGK